MPLRVIYRRALGDGDVAVSPCASLRLPAVRNLRERIVSPEQAAALLRALPEADRAAWAIALYAGLRRGELMALRWSDVDLAAGVIRIERSWDPKYVSSLSPRAEQVGKVPVAGVLRDLLVEHKIKAESDLVVGRNGGRNPFDADTVAERASRCWRLAGLDPITLHEARHTFASLMIAAGVNAQAFTKYMGHASVTITYDRYGHLMPGNLERANTRARREALNNRS